MPPKADSKTLVEKYRKELESVRERIKFFSEQIDQDPTCNRGTVNTALRHIEKVEKKFEDIQDKLEELVPEEKLNRSEYETLLNDLESRYRQRQSELDDENNLSRMASSTVVQPNLPNAPMLYPPFPKLPDLPLPKFDGSRKEWISFRSTIEDMFVVHNVELPDLFKYNYLKSSCTTGKAKDIVLAVKESSFSIAWENLKEHYDNDTLLQYMVLEELYSVATPKENDPKSLQEFVDTVESNVNYFKSIKVNTEQWSLLLGFHLMKRLDRASQVEFEKVRKADQVVTAKILTDFLKNRIRVLNVIAPVSRASTKPGTSFVDENKKKFQPNKHKSLKVTAEQLKRCGFCEQDHSVWNCQSLKNLSIPEIKAKARELRLCFNCFKPKHRVDECPSSNGCSKCGSKWHHSLIHPKNYVPNYSNPIQQTVPKTPMTDESKSNPSSSNRENVATSIGVAGGNVVLVTAVIWIKTPNETLVPCRAFLDSGSTCNFITTKLAQRLKLPLSRTNVSIEGVNCRESSNTQKTTATIQSRISDYCEQFDFLVSTKIMSDIPTHPVDTYDLDLPPQCQLADPLFHEPGGVDMLLGAEVFFSILKNDKVKLKNGLWLYDSDFGHLIAGKTTTVPEPKQISCVAISDLHDQLKKFWEIESCQSNEMGFSIEEKAVEKHYQANFKRLPGGKYQLALPFDKTSKELGESSTQTRSIYIASERRLRRSPEKKTHYTKQLQEMIDLNHMEPATDLTDPKFFMTHHMIERPLSATTKYRVVFNASKKSSSGVSLNDTLMIGPTIQPDVFTHLLKWREFPVALTGDITKMYRQIWIKPEHRKFQMIWWRPTDSSPVTPFQLNTVTYGTASAPFHAIRTLQQLAFDEVDRFPDVTDLLLKNFYVDDFMKSFVDTTEATRSKQRLTELLKSGGFELRKWASNVPELADELTATESTTAVLGVQWKKDTDEIILDFSYLKTHPKITKATVLSEIAQFFDPLGLSTPVILRAKCFMQRLWEEAELSWTDELNPELASEWLQFRNELIDIPQILVSRVLITDPDHSFILHGFSDASDIGYGACIYLTSSSSSRLICAKSRVAPLKRLTTPRLELIAALLLAKLIKKVVDSLSTKPAKICLWSDSEITVFRIKSAASRYNQFVSTRIAEIQDCTVPADWRFVPGEQNPADIASRGISPKEIVNNQLWWCGPEFILKPTEEWPNQSKFKAIDNPDELELKKFPVKAATRKLVNETDKITREFSSWSNMKRAVAKSIRWMLNSKKGPKFRNKATLSVQEIQDAELRLIRMVQAEYFNDEVQVLMKKSEVNKASRLMKLNPFIDESGVLRVGGRLTNSALKYDEQHQIILPVCEMSRSILVHLHNSNLHCGPQMLLSASRRRFWIIGARSMARSIVHKCITCFKNKPILLKQIMGDLPRRRVTPARPFLNVGIDFAGPFYIRPTPRSKTVWKTYIAVFTCFATRCVHLEVVPDLSTTSFLQAFRRFIARRGIPAYVCTDNATNFVGARNEIQELREMFLKKENIDSIQKFCTDNEIQWHTIPARSPHFGGLWESVVKQVKYHLKRTAKGKVFYPDHFHTLVVQIEGILNSRPLQPLSNNADDFQALTAGHFLIGAPLNALPEPDWSGISKNRLERWQEVQQMQSELWQRFQYDYLHQLQQRAKWSTSSPDIKINTIVLIHDDNLPSTQWKLGRVVKVYPGADGKIRVVDLKTADGELKRSIQKVAPLPIYDNDDNE